VICAVSRAAARLLPASHAQQGSLASRSFAWQTAVSVGVHTNADEGRSDAASSNMSWSGVQRATARLLLYRAHSNAEGGCVGSFRSEEQSASSSSTSLASASPVSAAIS
jgi:hypothetical protein